MKYTKYGIIFGLVLIMAGIVATLLYGYRPAPTRVMKPSFFDSADQIGVVALKRFYVPLAAEKVVFLGVPTNEEWAPRVVTGFLHAAHQNARAFDHVIIEAKISREWIEEISKSSPKLSEVDTNTETMAELTDLIQASEKRGERVLVVMPNIYTTHLLPGNSITRLEKILLPPDAQDTGRIVSLFALTVGPLALEAAQEKELDPVCMGSERDGSGTADLGCAILQAGRFFYRKRILDSEPRARERFVALMQSSRPNDYLLLVREPQNSGRRGN